MTFINSSWYLEIQVMFAKSKCMKIIISGQEPAATAKLWIFFFYYDRKHIVDIKDH